MVSLCSSPVPQWELLISPGCLASIADGREALLEIGGGWGVGAGVRTLARAWQVADKRLLHELSSTAGAQPLSFTH